MGKKKKSNKKSFSQVALDIFGVDMPVEEAPEEVTDVEEAPVLEEPAALAAPRDTKPTYLAESAHLEGTLRVGGDLEVRGDFQGTLEVSGQATVYADMTATVQAAGLHLVGSKLLGDCHIAGKLTIDAHSAVEGNIFAQELDCSGTITGDAHVTGESVFRAAARMEGNVETQGISVENGAVLTGNIQM